AAEIDGAVQRSRHHHIVGGIDLDPVATIRGSPAKALGPLEHPCCRELGHKDIAASRTAQRAASEVHGALKVPGDNEVIIVVDGHRPTGISTGAAKALGPQECTHGSVLSKEEVVAASTGE